MRRTWSRTLVCSAFSALALAEAEVAEACGCFAPPDPITPIVQAGEQIVFGFDDAGNVIAHVQLQYRGDAADFAWLLPLPSVPELGLGVQELFTQIAATTQPSYRLEVTTPDECAWKNRFGSGLDAGASAPDGSASDASAGGGPPIVVIEDSIGPYDYAVLRADDREEMLAWLGDNRYFVPTGTEDAVAPYIHTGAYFLALKLRNGRGVGELQPVVVKYASDRAMVPLILTSVAADPNMGVLVWLLGSARAIPINYRHTVINEARIDWFTGASNYNDVIIAATNEAPDGQSFVTEFAGSTESMRNQLNRPGRFGTRAEYRTLEDPLQYSRAMLQNGFSFDATVVGILRKYIPVPEQVVAERGGSDLGYYANLEYYLGFDRQRRPELYEGLDFTLDAAALTDELFERVVQPTIEAGQLFDRFAVLTRLYTTLSPEEMTRDPVFGFNPDLPYFSNLHLARFAYQCSGQQNGPSDTPGVLTLASGHHLQIPSPGRWSETLSSLPFTLRLERLREEGPAEIEVDNTPPPAPSPEIGRVAPTSDCACTHTAGRGSGLGLGLFFVLTAFACGSALKSSTSSSSIKRVSSRRNASRVA